MKTEQELQDRCTPEIIKKMVELAPGFRFTERKIFPNKTAYGLNYCGWSCETTENIVGMVFEFAFFPLLIHRAVEGWGYLSIYHRIKYVVSTAISDKVFKFEDYQTETLTSCECAMLDYLIEVLSK